MPSDRSLPSTTHVGRSCCERVLRSLQPDIFSYGAPAEEVGGNDNEAFQGDEIPSEYLHLMKWLLSRKVGL